MKSNRSPASSSGGEWATGLDERLRGFMKLLESADRPGKFLPCPEGATETGRAAGLPFACFALKIEVTLGLWDRRPEDERRRWIEFIQSFQREDEAEGDAPPANPFIDAALTDAGAMPPRPSGWRQLLGIRTIPDRSWLRILGETKQAIATLAEAGAEPLRTFGAFPLAPRQAEQYLRQLDWKRPWAAGAQASVLSVFTRTEAPKLIGQEKAEELSRAVAGFINTVADPESGTYFWKERPKRGQAINGAMKVLTALDWLDSPIHHPERLIDTCLEKPPKPEGCHLVDVVYVLDRCLEQTEHRREACREYAQRLMAMIGEHLRPDGGFSYFQETSEIEYQGRRIAEGRAEGDIHATCLLTWAIAMIDRISGETARGWKVIRP